MIWCEVSSWVCYKIMFVIIILFNESGNFQEFMYFSSFAILVNLPNQSLLFVIQF